MSSNLAGCTIFLPFFPKTKLKLPSFTTFSPAVSQKGQKREGVIPQFFYIRYTNYTGVFKRFSQERREKTFSNHGTSGKPGMSPPKNDTGISLNVPLCTDVA